MGLPPHAWLVQARLQKARQLLKQGVQIVMVAQQCGFSDQSHFNRHFKRRWVLHQPNMWRVLIFKFICSANRNFVQAKLS